jgi:hypothetical protein
VCRGRLRRSSASTLRTLRVEASNRAGRADRAPVPARSPGDGEVEQGGGGADLRRDLRQPGRGGDPPEALHQLGRGGDPPEGGGR